MRKDLEARSEYGKAHYEANKEAYRARSLAARKAREAYVNGVKSNPCLDCGFTGLPIQMHLDHIGSDKSADVSRLVRNKGMKAVIAEIAKCELVCANCHALRTYRRHHEGPSITLTS